MNKNLQNSEGFSFRLLQQFLNFILIIPWMTNMTISILGWILAKNRDYGSYIVVISE